MRLVVPYLCEQTLWRLPPNPIINVIQHLCYVGLMWSNFIWAPIIKWSMARLVVRNKHQNDACYDWDWVRELLHTSVPSSIQHKNLTHTSLLSKPMTTQPHQKHLMMISWRLRSGPLSISQGRNKITSISRIFSNVNVNYTWSNHWHHHNATSLLPTTTWTTDLALKLEDGQLPLALEILAYATFAPIWHLKMRHILC